MKINGTNKLKGYKWIRVECKKIGTNTNKENNENKMMTPVTIMHSTINITLTYAFHDNAYNDNYDDV